MVAYRKFQTFLFVCIVSIVISEKETQYHSVWKSHKKSHFATFADPTKRGKLGFTLMVLGH